VQTGFPKKSCFTKEPERQSIQPETIALERSGLREKKGGPMKKLAFGAIAAAALVAATAAPALAQVGVYAGPGGIGVDLGTPGYNRGGPYRGYYNYAPGSRAYRHHGWSGHRQYYYR
jgi:hypothetical protein